jgi:hypothetical protein
MAKYSDIKGFTVQTLSTDTIASQFAGGSWASGGSLNTAGYRGIGTGTQTAGLVAGGYATTANTEQYNGSSWTEVNDLNTARVAGGDNIGTYSATLYMSGATNPWPTLKSEVEQWDGTSWTEITDVNSARRDTFGCGSTTAAIMAGGLAGPGPSGYKALTESWNGSSWTEVNDLNNGRVYMGSAGTSSTAGLAVGGSSPPGGVRAFVEQWDGTSWTETTDISTAAEGRGTSGSYTECISFGGYTTTATATTEHWNGSSWTEIADLATARYSPRGQSGGTTAGAASAAWVAGGYTTTAIATTEEFTAPATFNQIQEGQLYFNSTTNTFKETISDVPGTSWSSGTNLNQARSFNNASGDLTSAITFGGSPAPTQAYSEQWDGSSWTEVGDLNEGRVAGAAGGASGTDAIMGGGYELPNIGNSVNTEIWNGSSWTEVNNLNAQKYTAGSGIPVSTSGIAFGGNPVVATAEVWDGTNWTEVGDLNTARMYLGGFGSATSAIASNGVNPGNSPAYTQNVVEKWDGTSWTEVSEMNTARGEMLQGQGSSNASGIISGGSTTGSNQIANTEIWNGSSWTELNDLGTAKRMGAQIGSTSSGMYIAGQAPSPSTSVEHWDSPLANKTISAS